jgi:hypothetical protein
MFLRFQWRSTMATIFLRRMNTTLERVNYLVDIRTQHVTRSLSTLCDEAAAAAAASAAATAAAATTARSK